MNYEQGKEISGEIVYIFIYDALRDICICKWKCQRCAGSQSDGKTERGSNLYKI